MTDSERMQEAKNFAVECAREAYPDLPKFYFKWDNRLTCSVGRIIWHGGYDNPKGWVEIKLSPKILFATAKQMGIEKACEEIHQTMLHELGHLIAGHPGHGNDWIQIVEKMGGNPEQFHHMPAGNKLAPQALRNQFPVGSTVCFVHKGQKVVGRVERHNPKNIKIRPLNSRQWWNMPWSIAAGRLAKV